jgi:hypothetical protein
LLLSFGRLAQAGPLPLALAALGGHRLLHQLHSLGHLLQIACVEAQVLVEPISQQAHGLAQIMGVAAQIGRVQAIGPPGLLQQAEQTHRHQARVVEIRTADVGQG